MRDKIYATARLYAIPFALTAVDQLTKFIMLEAIFFPPRTINLLPFLNFTPVWNKGISFGFLVDAGAWAPPLLTLFAVLFGLILPFVFRNSDKISRWGIMLMSGGALGNAIDRMIHGSVVDFIDVFAGQWHWPAFNVADIAIVIGAGILILGSMIGGRSQSKTDE
jgi:signal peptidase II